MKCRAPSPAVSENEADILDSLFTDEAEAVAVSTHENRQNGGAEPDFDFGGILNGARPNGGDGDEGDEAFIALQQAASFRKTSNLKGKAPKKGGGFQSMGLNPNLLRAITRKGFSVPTPIQRKTIPLILDRKDVVGMARTGSGKTAAFVIPMIERLKAHSSRVGARALVLSPSRELALQTLKVVKELGKGTDLKSVLLIGGDSLEDQFRLITSNPDIIIATPGRFLHLKVEMTLDLSSIQYVVFDEADRLFEMGFAAQLTEILHALPASRQTLLFSATLPSSLVEFARAGLQDPSLVRLDADTKVSPDLESAFFTVKGAEKEGALLHILQSVIKVPLGLPEGARRDAESDRMSKKRKRGSDNPNPKEKPTEHSTIVFAATKHHVEYLAALLRHCGFAVSYVYGSLDQVARRQQVDDFRHGRSHILVVTDVAARGIDIPILANVINYDFPPQPKVFVHRVGRTARAGQRGWSYSLVRDVDAPYLLDLQLFLGKRLVLGRGGDSGAASFAEDFVVGSLPRSQVEPSTEWVNKVLRESEDMAAMRRVAEKAERLYMNTRTSASHQSAKRARELVTSGAWMQLNVLFDNSADAGEQARAEMLAKIGGFKPHETIFEIGTAKKAARNEAAEVMRSLRAKVVPRKPASARDTGGKKIDLTVGKPADVRTSEGESGDEDVGHIDGDNDNFVSMDEDSDGELEVTVSSAAESKKRTDSWKDPEVFMSYTPRTLNSTEERGYGVHSSGSQHRSFAEAARDATMDLANDEGAKAFGVPTRSRLRWDKKAAKFVSRANDEDGSRGGGRMIRGESGVKIAASFQSGRFDRWRKANRLGRLPRVGETEQQKGSGKSVATAEGFRYKHKMEKAPKEADKYRDDYHVRKRRVAEAKEKRIGKYRDGAGSARELKGTEDIRRARRLKEMRRAKNARPSRKSGKR